MKTKKSGIKRKMAMAVQATALVLGVLGSITSAFAGETAAPEVASDGVNAKHARVDGLHLTRYIEMFLAFRSPDTGDVVAACYNSMFTPHGVPASRKLMGSVPLN